jgi:hypothetical protein
VLQHASKRYDAFRRGRNSHTMTLREAIALYDKAASLATAATGGRDGSTYAAAQVGLARCHRELTRRSDKPSAWRRAHVGEARSCLGKAQEEAVRSRNDGLQMRVDVELAGLAARAVEIDAGDPGRDGEGVAKDREDANGELERLVEVCEARGLADLAEQCRRWRTHMNGVVMGVGLGG